MALKIECPNCGRQYLPGEIYLPNHFTGQPKNVQRDILGKIIYNEGVNQDLKEEYICDGCGRLMRISANIKYNVQSIDLTGIDEEYRTKLKKEKLTLTE